MPDVGAPELLVIFAIIVVLFGAKRIPDVMSGMGTAIREFRRASRDDEPPPPLPQAACAAEPGEQRAIERPGPAPGRARPASRSPGAAGVGATRRCSARRRAWPASAGS